MLVVNNPPSDQIGIDAVSVYARIIFLGLSSGHTLGVDGRWAKTPQAPERGMFSSELNIPIVLPANGQPQALDVAVQNPADGTCYAFNDRNSNEASDGLLQAHALRDREYKVIITLRGSNTTEVRAAFRLFTGDTTEPVYFEHEDRLDSDHVARLTGQSVTSEN